MPKIQPLSGPGEIGDVVSSIPASKPERVTLSGRIVSVVPLNAEAHAQALFEGSHGTEAAHLWRYMPSGPYSDFPSFQQDLIKKDSQYDPLFFAVISNDTKRAIGLAAYLRIDPLNRSIEVGHILYTPELQRTIGATEAMVLMAQYVFEELRYRRYEWKCNALNQPSRAAALRLGFSFEGVFRQHMIVKGRNRDTAWFSMLDSEWPMRKAALECWLHPSNFDNAGHQKISLSRAST